jgi:signal transduction histidine kinase
MFAELQSAGKLPSADDRKRATAIIHRESVRLSHLVENILQFSRLRRLPEQLPKERVDLAEAAREGIDAVTPLIEDQGMRLDVAGRGSHLPVMANREALTRIVVNLLDNAVKYGPRGQTVQVRIERVNGSARFSVSDQGPGVPDADRPLVWKAYHRLERDVRANIPGTGIGLSVVADLASLHGGKAWVEAADPGGARFVVELPVLHEDAGPPANGDHA